MRERGRGKETGERETEIGERENERERRGREERFERKTGILRKRGEWARERPQDTERKEGGR